MPETEERPATPGQTQKQKKRRHSATAHDGEPHMTYLAPDPRQPKSAGTAETAETPRFSSPAPPKDGNIANAAASLGWSKRKQDPGSNPTSSLSPTRARPRSTRDRRQPSFAGQNPDAARAAFLAVGSPTRLSSPSPKSPQDAWINSAASQAFKSLSPQKTTFGSESDLAQSNHDRSLAAAKDAMSSTRPRSVSSPVPWSPQGLGLVASTGALSAAAIAHRPTTKSEAGVGGASPFVVMSRDMYTSNPPVQLEVEERREAGIRRAAVADMARGIHLVQQKKLEAALGRAHVAEDDASHSDDQAGTGGIGGSMPASLQLAAYHRAQERLKKLKAELDGSQRHQDRNSKLPRDGPGHRNVLMDAARRNVKAQIRDMDEKVLANTGRMAPALRGDWETKAHAIALAKYGARSGLEDKVDVGGGKSISRREVHAIALKRVQPMLEDLQEKARIEREKQELHEVERAARRISREQEHEKHRTLKREAKEARRREKDEERAGRQDRLGKPGQNRLAKEERLSRRDRDTADADNKSGERPRRPHSADGGSSPTRKVRTWLRSKLPIRSKPGVEPQEENEGGKGNDVKGFVGGKALTVTTAAAAAEAGGIQPSEAPASATLRGKRNRSVSRSVSEGDKTLRLRSDPKAVSPLTSSDEETGNGRKLPESATAVTPPKIRDPAAVSRPLSPGRDSRFREMLT